MEQQLPRIWNKHEEPFHWIFNPCASMTSTLSNDHSSQIVSEKKKNVERSKNLNTKRKILILFIFLLFHELVKTLISRNIEKWISSTEKVFSKKIENLYANVQKTQLVTYFVLATLRCTKWFHKNPWEDKRKRSAPLLKINFLQITKLLFITKNKIIIDHNFPLRAY